MGVAKVGVVKFHARSAGPPLTKILYPPLLLPDPLLNMHVTRFMNHWLCLKCVLVDVCKANHKALVNLLKDLLVVFKLHHVQITHQTANSETRWVLMFLLESSETYSSLLPL